MDVTANSRWAGAARFAVAAGLLAVGVSTLIPSWQSPGGLVLLAAALSPLGLALLVRRAGLQPPAVSLLLLALGVLGIGWLLRKSETAVADAIPRLLTTRPPAPATAGLLAPGLALVWLLGTTAALGLIATRPRAGTVAPLLASVSAYLAGLLLSGGSTDRHGLAAAGLLGLAVLGWWLADATADAALGRAGRRAARAIPAVAALLVIAVAIVAVIPGDHPFSPRALVEPPSVQIEESNPLSQLAVWGRNPTVEILTARSSGTDRLRLVTLSDFGGDSWRVAADYHDIAAIAHPDLPAGPKRVPTTATVRISQLAGHWLPTAGAAQTVSIPDAYRDPDTGGLAVADQVRAGLTYRTAGAIDSPSDDVLRVAGTITDPRYLSVPRLPVIFAQYAQRAVRGAGTPFEQAVAIEHAVTTGRQLAPDAPTGTSYARLQAFLFGRSGTAGALVGSSEQFAAGFAVLARSVGLPTRLVVGFTLGRPEASGASTVRGRNAEAWPEVYFAGAGWVPFDPTPGGTANDGDAAARRLVLDKLSKLPPPAPTQSSAPLTGPTVAGGSAVTTAAVDRSPRPTLALTGLGILLLAVLISLGLLAARSRRRRRHRRAGARGAWAELLDLLLVAGAPAAPALSAPAIADALVGRVPAESVHAARTVAAAADRAAFAPPEARMAGPEVEWSQLVRFRRAFVATVPRRRRWLMPFDPRPLRVDRRRREVASMPPRSDVVGATRRG